MGRGRLLIAIGLALGGLSALLVLASRQWGPWQTAESRPLLLVDPSPVVLDSVRLQGRLVTASLSGIVQAVDPEGTVWLVDAGHTFPVVFPSTHKVIVPDRVLLVGRLRGQRGQRWLDVTDWTVVVPDVR
jgi:hypothetical protein